MKDAPWNDFELMANEVISCCDPRPLNINMTMMAALRDAWEMGRRGLAYSELANARRMDGAQPIDTHPTDNTIVDLIVGNERIAGCYWEPRKNGGEWCKAGSGRYALGYKEKPTHWAPSDITWEDLRSLTNVG